MFFNDTATTEIYTRRSKILLLEKIRWMFGGGDGAERDRKEPFPSFHSSWFLALLLASIRYANNHVPAKVSDYID